MRWILLWVLLTGSAVADGERAGDFDYYVMALSWTPSYCATEGDAREAEQCDPARDLGWVLHGLWPQYEEGWPSFCASAAANPSRRQTAAMADIMGAPGLAWYQWKKHGRCSGLEATDYYALARRAYESVTPPPVLRKLSESVVLPAAVVEEAWLEANPELSADMVTVTCQSGRIMETRICLTRDLEPRACAPDARRDCTLSRALLDPVR
ncbi:ribonuclease T2 family protein [Tropicimonas isoalkanivorans]|uniref:Ribonuclease T2 n=1 Tax=Tropicimonas isoalkanivorans TaxID=441112 RepID=A0A1I1P9K5_9RHOB|nr:ribonuclease T2 [Tropicimonas isoalkanivorans]SFD06517.1 ribonuclease T2 [Tropicimonas isoalkanivorans]